MKTANQQTQFFMETPAQPTMTNGEFELLSSFIYKQCGIKLNPYKKLMLTSRLYKLLKKYNMKNFREYYQLIKNAGQNDEELITMLNAVSTNKTDFFREPYHFEYLQAIALKKICERKSHNDIIHMWSAGCSSGEEAYSLAMVTDDYLYSQTGFSFSILCSDISTNVLGKTRLGIYDQNRIEPIPGFYKKRYLMKGTGPREGTFRVIPELRNRIRTERINLVNENFKVHEAMDIIFFRNVMIYFDQPTQRKIIKQLYNRLVKGGYLFIGHSETLNEINNDFKMVAPKVYIKE